MVVLSFSLQVSYWAVWQTATKTYCLQWRFISFLFLFQFVESFHEIITSIYHRLSHQHNYPVRHLFTLFALLSRQHTQTWVTFYLRSLVCSPSSTTRTLRPQTESRNSQTANCQTLAPQESSETSKAQIYRIQKVLSFRIFFLWKQTQTRAQTHQLLVTKHTLHYWTTSICLPLRIHTNKEAFVRIKLTLRHESAQTPYAPAPV